VIGNGRHYHGQSGAGTKKRKEKKTLVQRQDMLD